MDILFENDALNSSGGSQKWWFSLLLVAVCLEPSEIWG